MDVNGSKSTGMPTCNQCKVHRGLNAECVKHSRYDRLHSDVYFVM